MAMSPVGLGTKNDRAGESLQQFARPTYEHACTHIHRLYRSHMDAYSFIIIKWNWSVVNSDSAMGWTSGVQSPTGTNEFSLIYSVKTGSGAHSASYPMSAGICSPGIKRQWSLVDHSPPSGSEVKNCGPVPPLSLSLPGIVFNCISVGISYCSTLS
jgi:hypothetical protein